MNLPDELDLSFERLLLESGEDENEVDDIMSSTNTNFFVLMKVVLRHPKKTNLIP